ncbi:MAG: TolC family protein [Lewinella sp.]|nr:TolC family protein [Lewinella sp.]
MLQQSKLARMPNINGSSNLGLQLGRTIDPTTNTFQQQSITFNSLQLQANMTLFNGNQLTNSIRQAELDYQASALETETTANNVALNVANGYLTILLAREQLANARTQLQLTEDQLRQTEAAIRAGSLPESQRYDLVAQRAANQRSIVDFENQVQLALLSLQILLQLDPSQPFDILTPQIELSPSYLTEINTFEEVYQAAAISQPVLRAAEARNGSAALGLKIAASQALPSLSLFGGLSSNYSSLGQSFTVTNNIVQGPDVPVIINGVPGTVANFQPEVISEKNLTLTNSTKTSVKTLG